MSEKAYGDEFSNGQWYEQLRHLEWARKHIDEWLIICLAQEITEKQYLDIAEMLVENKLLAYYHILLTRFEEIGAPYHKKIVEEIVGITV